MARHLAICERKSAYPSRKEAKSAIVTHSMLDVLGLVRKPEEGPSGIKKTTSLVNNKEKETVVIEDSEVSLGSRMETEQETEKENKEVSDKMETQEIVAVDVGESEGIKNGEEAEKNESDNQKEETSKENEEEKESNEETVRQTENTKVVDEEVKESNEELTRDDSQVTDKEAYKQESEMKNEEIEKVEKEQQEKESSGSEETTNEIVDSNSPELEKSEQLEPETKSPGQPTEEKETIEDIAEKETEHDSSEKQSIAEDIKTNEEIPEETEVNQNVPVEEKTVSPSVSPVQQKATDEEPGQESYSAPVEKMSPAGEMGTAEAAPEKQNTMDSEITSDDIQNLISDVVGEKSNSDLNFDDVQNMDETQSMETETENVNSDRAEDVNMQITRDESLGAMRNDAAAMESVVTPMETD